MLEYHINAVSGPPGKAHAKANESEIHFDATSGRDDVLPNPAELLLSALAACILKNVQRYSEILKFPYRSAGVVVKGLRNDSSPSMSEIQYELKIDTDIDERKFAVWHKNIIKFGTITNTLSKACKVTGTIEKGKNNENF